MRGLLENQQDWNSESEGYGLKQEQIQEKSESSNTH